jgi:hypothetical protein
VRGGDPLPPEGPRQGCGWTILGIQDQETGVCGTWGRVEGRKGLKSGTQGDYRLFYPGRILIVPAQILRSPLLDLLTAGSSQGVG